MIVAVEVVSTKQTAHYIRANIAHVIIGKAPIVELLLVALLCVRVIAQEVSHGFPQHTI